MSALFTSSSERGCIKRYWMPDVINTAIAALNTNLGLDLNSRNNNCLISKDKIEMIKKALTPNIKLFIRRMKTFSLINPSILNLILYMVFK